MIEDSYGDGIYGIPWCQTSGNVVISSLGDSLTGISAANSDFGYSETLTFCINGGEINSLNNETFTLYPNPAQEIVHWVSSNTVHSYSLHDILGKQILVNPFVKATQFSLSIANLSPGMYILDCTFENGNSGRVHLIKN